MQLSSRVVRLRPPASPYVIRCCILPHSPSSVNRREAENPVAGSLLTSPITDEVHVAPTMTWSWTRMPLKLFDFAAPPGDVEKRKEPLRQKPKRLGISYSGTSARLNADHAMLATKSVARFRDTLFTRWLSAADSV